MRTGGVSHVAPADDGGCAHAQIRLLLAGVVAGLIVSSPGFAQDKASLKFKEAMEGNLAEVQMGQLAQKNVLNRPPRMAAERPAKLTREASDELIAEAKDELAVKTKGQAVADEELEPIIADLRRLTG